VDQAKKAAVAATVLTLLHPMDEEETYFEFIKFPPFD